MIYFYSLVMRKAYHLENGEFKKYKSIKVANKTTTTTSDRRTSVRQMSDSIIHMNSIAACTTTNSGGGKRTSTYNNGNCIRRMDSEQVAPCDEIGENDGDQQQQQHRNSQDLARNWRREYRLIKTLGIVIAVFILCWVFFFARYTLCGRENSICPSWIANNLVLEDMLFWIGYFNSALNPFLYNYTNRDFRRAFRDLLHMNKRRSTTPVGGSVPLGAAGRQPNDSSSGSSTNRLGSLLCCLCSCCCCCDDKRADRLQSFSSSRANSRKPTLEETKTFVQRV